MNNVILVDAAGVPATPRGRLVFGLDATGSRQPTWDTAVELQAEMFRSTAPIGKLDVQLVFFGGDRCRASGWVGSGEELARSMRRITCEAGTTQIGRVLAHVRRETERSPVQSLIFIGDAMEEGLDELAGAAAELGRLRTPAHMFQEGRNPEVSAAFHLIALRSGGRYHEFNTSTPQAVAQLVAKLADVARVAVQNAALLTHRK
jgi:hypothetical protein